MPNYKQLLETAAAYLPSSLWGWTAALGATAAATIIPSTMYDLYQRYKRYVLLADASADFLVDGIHGMHNNADHNIEQHLDTFRQINDLRNQRQDDARAHLSPLGLFYSQFLREGHSDIDELIAKNIASIARGRDAITDEEFEWALQNAIAGATRTRGSLTYFARKIGGPIYRFLGR